MKEKIQLGQIFCGEYSENCEVDRMSCPFSDCMAEVWAEKILSLGYHKMVWHEVVEGNLPVRDDWYICALTDEETVWVRPMKFRRGIFVIPEDPRVFDGIAHKQVIAWTELPKYEE